jgi:hypothetical protein
MSDEFEKKAFFEMADQFIKLANELGSAGQHRAHVSASMQYATARFNAFTWQHRENNRDHTKEQAVEYYVKRYEAMLRENLDIVLGAPQN